MFCGFACSKEGKILCGVINFLNYCNSFFSCIKRTTKKGTMAYISIYINRWGLQRFFRNILLVLHRKMFIFFSSRFVMHVIKNKLIHLLLDLGGNNCHRHTLYIYWIWIIKWNLSSFHSPFSIKYYLINTQTPSRLLFVFRLRHTK